MIQRRLSWPVRKDDTNLPSIPYFSEKGRVLGIKKNKEDEESPEGREARRKRIIETPREEDRYPVSYRDPEKGQ